MVHKDGMTRVCGKWLASGHGLRTRSWARQKRGYGGSLVVSGDEDGSEVAVGGWIGRRVIRGSK